jgi:hypothetical protein
MAVVVLLRYAALSRLSYAMRMPFSPKSTSIEYLQLVLIWDHDDDGPD